MKATLSPMVRSEWLKIAALSLLAAIPLLLAKRSDPLSPAGGETPSHDASSGLAKNADVEARDDGASSDESETSQAAKPTKTRERNPRPGQEAAVAQQASLGSNISSGESDHRSGTTSSTTRRQRASRDEGSPADAEVSHHASHAPGTEASSTATFSPAVAYGALASQTTTEPGAASPVAAKPSASKPAVTRPPEMPISHLIDDEVAMEVAPEVPADTMEAIRQTFEQEAGVNELAQDDPVYAERWSQAEQDAAERIRAVYGWGAFEAFQRKLVMEKLAATNAEGGQ